MERLTKQWGNNHAVPTEIDLDFMFRLDDPTSHGLTEIIDRLAAYEDSGLEPEEVTRLQLNSAYGVKQAMLEEYMSIGIIDHLRELVQAEKEGRLVVLPCQPDAPFYQWKKGDHCPSVSRFEGVEISEDGEITYLMKRWGEVFTLDDFGKTVFLTRQEAEAAQETKKGGEGNA